LILAHTALVKRKMLSHRIGFLFTHVVNAIQNIVRMMAPHARIVVLPTIANMIKYTHRNLLFIRYGGLHDLLRAVRFLFDLS